MGLRKSQKRFLDELNVQITLCRVRGDLQPLQRMLSLVEDLIHTQAYFAYPPALHQSVCPSERRYRRDLGYGASNRIVEKCAPCQHCSKNYYSQSENSHRVLADFPDDCKGGCHSIPRHKQESNQ